MKYLILLDKNELRITTLVTGVHGDNVDDLKTYAKKTYKEVYKMVEMNEKEYNNFLINESLKNQPTEEEKLKYEQISDLKQKEENLKQTLDEINRDFITALIEGDEELQEELKEERRKILEME